MSVKLRGMTLFVLKDIWSFWICGWLKILINIYVAVIIAYHIVMFMMKFGYTPPTLIGF